MTEKRIVDTLFADNIMEGVNPHFLETCTSFPALTKIEDYFENLNIMGQELIVMQLQMLTYNNSSTKLQQRETITLIITTTGTARKEDNFKLFHATEQVVCCSSSMSKNLGFGFFFKKNPIEKY
ncbi:hypothetical protein ACJX0J_035402 [Zea mays]